MAKVADIEKNMITNDLDKNNFEEAETGFSKTMKFLNPFLYVFQLILNGFDLYLGLKLGYIMYTQIPCLRPVLSLTRVYDSGVPNLGFADIVVYIFLGGVITDIYGFFVYAIRLGLGIFHFGIFQGLTYESEAMNRRNTYEHMHWFWIIEFIMVLGKGLQCYSLLTIASWNSAPSLTVLSKLVLSILQTDWRGAHIFNLFFFSMFKARKGFTKRIYFTLAKAAFTFGAAFYPLMSVTYFVSYNRTPVYINATITNAQVWYGCQNPNSISCIYNSTNPHYSLASINSFISDTPSPLNLTCNWTNCSSSTASWNTSMPATVQNTCISLMTCQALNFPSAFPSNSSVSPFGPPVVRLLTTQGTGWTMPIIIFNKTLGVYEQPLLGNENFIPIGFRGSHNVTFQTQDFHAPAVDSWYANVNITIWYQPHGGCPLDN